MKGRYERYSKENLKLEYYKILQIAFDFSNTNFDLSEES